MESLEEIDRLFDALQSKDDKVRYPAFKRLLAITEQPVAWVYDKWHDLTGKLISENSYQRTIGFMLLANLAKSDTEGRIVNKLAVLLQFTDDEKFITSRQCIQNVWQLAVNKSDIESKVVRHLERAWTDNIHLATHPNLIKQDIVASLSAIYRVNGNVMVKETIDRLINQEADDKFVKKLKQFAK